MIGSKYEKIVIFNQAFLENIYINYLVRLTGMLTVISSKIRTIGGKG